jgi:hypothetical protein
MGRTWKIMFDTTLTLAIEIGVMPSNTGSSVQIDVVTALSLYPLWGPLHPSNMAPMGLARSYY